MTDEPTTEMTTPPGEYFYGTGRRKEAVARVRLYPGSGNILINGKPYLEMFTRSVYQIKIRQPLEVTSTASQFDVYAKIKGGGITGWADALQLLCVAWLQDDEAVRQLGIGLIQHPQHAVFKHPRAEVGHPLLRQPIDGLVRCFQHGRLLRRHTLVRRAVAIEGSFGWGRRFCF
ncbi:MAG: 30S ribosomal protein S9 [Bacteroidetes bacterium]|nr:30S ribosomal protein S9 [Bacteroidota bacterium]